MIAAIVGCGSWGSRVARRLSEMDDVLVSAVFDADYHRAHALAHSLPGYRNGDRPTAARDFGQYLDVQTPDAVILAVPPGQREPYIRAIEASPRTRKPRIRVEKPMAETTADATDLAHRCAAMGAQLTVGFTLLHHPLYDAAFGYFDAVNERVERVVALRAGRAPAHAVDPMLDQGIHAASIAAHLGVGRRHTDIVAMHSPTSGARTTILFGAAGSRVTVDELSLHVTTPHGRIHVGDGHDALGCDLRSWVDGTHRGSAQVGCAAQQIADAHMTGVAPRIAAAVAA